MAKAAQRVVEQTFHRIVDKEMARCKVDGGDEALEELR
jgi:hypothetical protein